jgi:hypothetical protein
MNELVSNAEKLLIQSTRFDEDANQHYIDKHKDEIPHILYGVLSHLSEPSDPHGKKQSLHEEEQLDEVTVLDVRKGITPYTSSATSFSDRRMSGSRTSRVIQAGQREHTGENLYKKIGEGFKQAYDEMEIEHPRETRAKLNLAKATFKTFAQSRGYKGTSTKLLRGNLKTKKSSGEGVLTTGLNLAPHKTAGLEKFDVCPKATKECREGCLGLTAGGNRYDSALASKVLTTHFIAAHPHHAARMIDHEIGLHAKKAERMGMKPGVRLNITSDIAWEHHAPKMFQKHSNVQFYDYTKMPNRVLRSLAPKKSEADFHNSMGHPSNYHLTLSHTGSGHEESNDKDVIKVLDKGGSVAAVFQRGKAAGGLPTHIEDVKTGKRYPVMQGDKDDNTFDRPNAVSGLMLKGVKNHEVGKFANKVDADRIARINHD